RLATPGVEHGGHCAGRRIGAGDRAGHDERPLARGARDRVDVLDAADLDAAPPLHRSPPALCHSEWPMLLHGDPAGHAVPVMIGTEQTEMAGLLRPEEEILRLA